MLSKELRASKFKYLGLGKYNKKNILAFQKKAFPNHKEEWDGKWGPHSDNALRTFYNVKRYAPNFKPEEFKCECGGRYCTGYPSYMKQVELKHLQSIRTHYGKPMQITCGLRCKPYNNSLRGSIPNSKHLTGYAADFYMAGVTDTLANRKSAINWIRKQPNHGYSYGNGYNSYGAAISAGYMGNCIHTDTNKPKKTTQTATDPLQKWYDALKTQYEWSKNATYAWVEPPTVANSKKKCTCISLHSVALQRLGLLPKGGYFYYHPTKKKISGNRANYVKKHTELFKLSYPNKKLKTLIKEGKLKKGDIVGFGNPGYHSMVYMGKNTKGEPIFATMGHRRGYKVTYSYYAKRKVNMLVRLKKVKK